MSEKGVKRPWMHCNTTSRDIRQPWLLEESYARIHLILSRIREKERLSSNYGLEKMSRQCLALEREYT